MTDPLELNFDLGQSAGDTQALEFLRLQLQCELRYVPIERIVVPTGTAQDGTRSGEVLECGKLAVEVATSAAMLQVIALLRDWVRRDRHRHIRVHLQDRSVDIDGYSEKTVDRILQELGHEACA